MTDLSIIRQLSERFARDVFTVPPEELPRAVNEFAVHVLLTCAPISNRTLVERVTSIVNQHPSGILPKDLYAHISAPSVDVHAACRAATRIGLIVRWGHTQDAMYFPIAVRDKSVLVDLTARIAAVVSRTERGISIASLRKAIGNPEISAFVLACRNAIAAQRVVSRTFDGVRYLMPPPRIVVHAENIGQYARTLLPDKCKLVDLVTNAANGVSPRALKSQLAFSDTRFRFASFAALAMGAIYRVGARRSIRYVSSASTSHEIQPEMMLLNRLVASVKSQPDGIYRSELQAELAVSEYRMWIVGEVAVGLGAIVGVMRQEGRVFYPANRSETPSRVHSNGDGHYHAVPVRLPCTTA
ncbi:hypothetical protein [Pendulispora albinea]|uniref:Uncharacterized protein n=1 Tax=Pendulispora albinea TaxID=2741071 RepID=A0ABZ2LPM3_9BACT